MIERGAPARERRLIAEIGRHELISIYRQEYHHKIIAAETGSSQAAFTTRCPLSA
jgi:hypothetical protein